MFDLNAGIHFHEIKATASVQEEFHRSGPLVIDASRRCHCCISHLTTQLRVEGRAWRFLEKFLMASLDRTVPFAEMNHVAVPVREDLHLDVPGTVDEFFHVQPWIPKGCIGFSLSRFVQLH